MQFLCIISPSNEISYKSKKKEFVSTQQCAYVRNMAVLLTSMVILDWIYVLILIDWLIDFI